MNSAYAPQASSPHDMSFPRNPHDAAPYRGPAPGGAPQYPPHPHSMPLPPPQAPVNQQYGDPYNAMQASRPPPQAESSTHAGDGLATLAPGVQPQAPPPSPRSIVENGWKYELSVVQQPRRARMCGFGDKDRRPITPPPCVRLIITDVKTGKEVDVNEIEHGMFVLNVDLWSPDGTREVTLVRHSSTSPSISSTSPVSYQQAETSNVAYSNIMPQSNMVKFEGQGAGYNPYPGSPQVNPYAGGQAPPYGAAQPYYPPQANGSQPYPPPNGYSQPPGQQMYYTTGAGIHASGAGPAPGAEYPQQGLQAPQYGGRPFTPGDGAHRLPTTSTPQGMFTRNLIGSLAASAFRLTDPDDKIGIWFVLQDLSVRTEGTFRLRFSFVNVGITQSPASPTGPSNTGITQTSVNTGKAPVLASCFSEVFTVYSAKRFPGVVESTHLSKCFATQGIKIPIRKDGPGKGDKGGGDDDYD